MFFNKYPHRANFSFSDAIGTDLGMQTAQFGAKSAKVSVQGYEGNVFEISLANPDLWSPNPSLAPLVVPPVATDGVLPVVPQVGLMGEKSLWAITLPEGTRFYGMGEKNLAEFELSGQRTRFWNTDVWSDFPAQQWGSSPTDPPYFSTPYVIAHTGEEWLGFLLHNPYPAFMETPGMDESRVFVEWQRTGSDLILGSEGGEPHLWILTADSLAELTRNFQRLVGVTPVPPIWSLGYHQSRWGYGGHEDLMKLDAAFADHKIPCDGLWMDLDYMDGYRIFTTSETAFPNGPKATADALAKNGRRIVPIIDPGVKSDPGYAVYDDGTKKNVWCHNPEGNPYIGLVWPGETVFPDFTVGRVRDWWADYATKFRTVGYAGCWLDMNDPSTGPVDPYGMRFGQGTEPHEAHRNQYGLGMQMATHAGFLTHSPNERPFILSRSGYTGSSQYAAIWTGDNLSNYFYLALSIPTSLGLSLSGCPFNGPDLAGFGGDVTDQLMIDWTKAGFLFPFLRNHCNRGQREQEPFAFPKGVMGVVRHYIRLRYKLMPYLYNLFIEQESAGDPILRPLLYGFEGDDLAKVKDQFLVGPSILQAPFVAENAKRRTVILPGAEPWYDASIGAWREPGVITATKSNDSTPLFIRAGAIVPMQRGTPVDNHKELREIDLHVFIPPKWSGNVTYEYSADDGISFDYRSGGRSTLRIDLVAVDGHIAITTAETATGFGSIRPRFVFHGAPASVRLDSTAPTLIDDFTVMTGKKVAVRRTA